jgi:hypothetical protein
MHSSKKKEISKAGTQTGLARQITLPEVAAQLEACRALNSTEALILRLEAGEPLSRLSPTDLHNVCIDILSEIKIITGVLIYADGSPEQIAQVRMFTRLLTRTRKYLCRTRDEVTQAFYMNAAGYFPEVYRHYNRELNAEFFCDVLNAYQAWKDKHLSQKIGIIQNLLNPPPARPVPVRGQTQIREEIVYDLALYRGGRGDLIFNTTSKYIFLRQMGYISIRSRDHFGSWYRYAADTRRAEVTRRPAKTKGEQMEKGRLIDVLTNLLDKGEIPREYHRGFIHYTRRVIYLQHIRALVATGIYDPFGQVAPDVHRPRWMNKK